jgi:alkylation response protein AidB-like acyl-CoA dehydrogenase
LLRESADRFVSETYTPITAAGRRRSAGFSAKSGNSSPISAGWRCRSPRPMGLGGGAIEIGILMEAFGRGLVSEPYLSTVVIGASLISECGSEAQKQALLPKIADGSLVLAFAHSERQARFDLADVRTAAKKTPDGWRLDGHKTAVLDGSAAGQIIVSARVDDGNGKPGKLSLFLVPQGPASPYATFRGLAAAGVQSRTQDVQLPADALLGDGSDALPRSKPWSTAHRCTRG